jgi:hypothetical protein
VNWSSKRRSRFRIRARVDALGMVAHDAEGGVGGPQAVSPGSHALVVPVPEQLHPPHPPRQEEEWSYQSD